MVVDVLQDGAQLALFCSDAVDALPAPAEQGACRPPPAGGGPLRLCPVSLRQCQEFVAQHHRHNKPPVGWKFGVGVMTGDQLRGVATAGRPVARHFDDGLTLEVNRTCTDGARNANSMLYGAVWRAAKAMGYARCITYIQDEETGASLKAAGWVKVKDLAARGSWAESTADEKLKAMRDAKGNGGVARQLWEIRSGAAC